MAICQDSQGYGQDWAAECQLHDFMMANYVITQLGHVNGWRQAQSTVQILDVASVKDVDRVSLLNKSRWCGTSSRAKIHELFVQR